MQNQEQQIGLVEKIIEYPETYNLVWTDKRLVILNTKTQRNVGAGLIPSLIGEGITKFNQSRKKEKTKDLTLDELLAKDDKSFAVPYETVEQMRLIDPQSRWKNRKLEIRLIDSAKPKLHGNFWSDANKIEGKNSVIDRAYNLTKVQFEQLTAILPNIPELSGKLMRQ